MPLLKQLTAFFFILCTLLAEQAVGQTKYSTSFTFTLAGSARTSAGVFAKDGTLVRTLWSGTTYEAGSYTQTWDGKDDEGLLAPDADYTVKVLSNKVTYTWEGLIGNTSSAQSGSTHIQAMENIASMAITGNTAYYAVHYNEQQGSCFKLNTTSPQAKTNVLGKGAMVWLVATDGTRVYWGGADPNKTDVSFVFVTNTANDAETTLSNATSVQTAYGRKYTSALSVMTNVNSALSGLAVQKTGNYLLVSRQKLNTIYVLNKTTGALVTTVSANSPRELAIDRDDNVWLITGTNTIAHYKINANGTLSASNKSLSGLVDPLALSVSPDGATIIVADGGSSQQLKGFNTVSASSVWTFGQVGGYAINPTVTNDKFYFSDARAIRNPIAPADTKFISTFISFETDGSFWVGDLGNNRVQHFKSDRSFINRIMYLTGSLNCSVDHNNPSRVFSDFLEFKVDYTRPLDPTNNSWTLVKNWGAIIPKAYDANLYIGRFRFVETLKNGRTYSVLCVSKSNVITYELVELPASGQLRFTGITFPNGGYQLYPDGSLRVQSMAQLGSPITWQKKVLTGFDNLNNPLWGDLQSVASSPPLTSADPGYRGNPVSLTAGEITSSNVVVAFDGGRVPYGSGSWYHLGGVKAGTSEWLWRTAPSTSKLYTGDYPTDGAFDIGNGVNNAGSRALALERNIFWGYYGEFWKGTQTNKWQHVYDNGLFVGVFGVTGKDGPSYEPFAQMTGNAFSCYVVKSPIDAGTAYLYHNDDGWQSGLHRWKISGLNTISEQSTPVTLRVEKRGLSGDYFDGHELNNSGLKTTRVDATIDVDWPNGPKETALAAPTNFSVRWQGFIQPLFSEDYSFYTETNGKLRLWVDDNLIIDQWTNTTLKPFSSTPISLKAGKRYTIRLEYTPIGNAAQVDLAWSSKSQPKQIIPSSQLIPAETESAAEGVDLMAFLPADKILENNLYGWSRTPVSEDYGDIYRQWWSAKTGIKSYNSVNRSDLWVKFVRNTSSSAYTVTRNLSAKTGYTSWRLSGKVYYDGEDGNKSNGGVGYFEVIDDQAKVLTRIHISNDYPNLTMYANNKLVAQLPKADFLDIAYRVQPLDIQVTDGIATIKYGPFPAVTVGLLDASANWKNPRTMRMFFTGNTDGSGHAFGIESMRFLASAAASTDGSGTGLRADYFQNINLTGSAVLTRIDQTINFQWGQASPAPGTVNQELFSVRWSGQVQAPVSGNYTFTTTTDDGVRLWVNGRQLINDWIGHPATTNSGAILTLTAGQKYDIKMEYFDAVSSATAKLLWAYPGQSQQVVPKARLYPAPGASNRESTVDSMISSEDMEVQVYPIPAHEEIQIRYYAETAGEVKVQLVNSIGQVVIGSVHQATPGKNVLGVPVRQLNHGFYLITLTQGNRRITRKVVISE